MGGVGGWEGADLESVESGGEDREDWEEDGGVGGLPEDDTEGGEGVGGARDDG